MIFFKDVLFNRFAKRLTFVPKDTTICLSTREISMIQGGNMPCDLSTRGARSAVDSAPSGALSIAALR
jgi:hypothetical protein